MILFEKVRWKNFLSTGNQFTELTFTDHNTTLIVGTNGTGKSTVLDALTFSLFGRPLEKLINLNWLIQLMKRIVKLRLNFLLDRQIGG